MVALVKFVDEFPGRPRGPAIDLRLASERVTARELVTRRVRQEIEVARERREENTRSFLIRFDPTAPERAVNGASRSKPVLLDEDNEVAAAIDGFAANKFIMLVDDRQVGDLDEPIVLTPDSEVVFLRLTPLAGG